jgi:type VI protein secretion system component Hcp
MDIPAFTDKGDFHGEILSFSWGETGRGVGSGATGGGTAAVRVDKVNVLRKQDRDSVYFSRHYLSGDRFKKVTISFEMRDPDGSLQRRVGWVFDDVLIIGVQVAGEGGDTTESLILSFTTNTPLKP